MSGTSTRHLAWQDTGTIRTGGPPAIAVRLVGALLAIAVSGVHVADAGGITAFSPPGWLAWGYRLIEAGGVLTAVVLLLPRLPRLPEPMWLGWAASVLLGAVPFLGYVASRTVGVPGDHGDIGNWGNWVGTVSLIVEAAVVVLGVSMLAAARQDPPGPAAKAT